MGWALEEAVGAHLLIGTEVSKAKLDVALRSDHNTQDHSTRHPPLYLS
jgi:hypothetical protein